MVFKHEQLAAGGWGQFSLAEQLANIGSEITRALNWQAKGDREMTEKALVRGLELFDLTVGDSRFKHRLKEVLRAREMVCDYFFGDNIYHSTPEFFTSYFFYFALATRLKH